MNDEKPTNVVEFNIEKPLKFWGYTVEEAGYDLDTDTVYVWCPDGCLVYDSIHHDKPYCFRFPAEVDDNRVTITKVPGDLYGPTFSDSHNRQNEKALWDMFRANNISFDMKEHFAPFA
jgi:hypothetical protein